MIYNPFEGKGYRVQAVGNYIFPHYPHIPRNIKVALQPTVVEKFNHGYIYVATD